MKLNIYFLIVIIMLFFGCSDQFDLDSEEITSNDQNTTDKIIPMDDDEFIDLETKPTNPTNYGYIHNLNGTQSPYITATQNPSKKYHLAINLRPSGYIPYQKVRFEILYENNPSGWLVNIGDSQSNDGWAGDYSHQKNDAEMQIKDGTLAVYKSDYGNSQLYHSASGYADSWDTVTIEISNQRVTYWKNNGSKTNLVNQHLFALNGQADTNINYTIYAAFNRVINNANRSGEGVKSVKITLLDPIYNPLSFNDKTVSLNHIMYNKWSNFAFRWHFNPSFAGYGYLIQKHHELNWDNITLKHVFASQVWTPPPANVENIVFISAGQQGSTLIYDALGSAGTGQKSNYDSGSGILGWKGVRNKNVTIENYSIAGQILADAYNNNSKYFGMNASNTYFILVFDAAFNQHANPTYKQDMVYNYIDWIMSKCADNVLGNLKRIYLVGESRGGSLVTRMAYQMRKNWAYRFALANTSITVSTIDAVAKVSDGEVFTEQVYFFNNPVGPGWCYYSKLKEVFESTSLDQTDTHIYQIAAGQEVIHELLFTHAYKFYEIEDILKFKWVNYSHTSMCQNWQYDVCTEQLIWMNEWSTPFVTKMLLSDRPYY